MTNERKLSHPVLHPGQERVPEECDGADVHNPELCGQEVEVDELGRRPYAPVNLKRK